MRFVLFDPELLFNFVRFDGSRLPRSGFKEVHQVFVPTSALDFPIKVTDSDSNTATRFCSFTHM